jgi:hypothetical protein
MLCSYAVDAVMTARPLLHLLVPAAVLGASALPATAVAAPVLVNGPKACYVTVDPAARELMKLRATGFAPLHAVDLLFDGVRQISFDSNTAGVVRVREQVPYQPSGERPLTVTLRDHVEPGTEVTTTTRVTALRVQLRPRRAATSDLIRFTGRGFTQPRPIWAHYVFQGRARKTVRFAAGPASACGTFSVRRPQIPILRPRAGRWKLQVDQQKRYSLTPRSVFVPVPITVRRIIGG